MDFPCDYASKLSVVVNMPAENSPEEEKEQQ
jgi:hypothetical protein